MCRAELGAGSLPLLATLHSAPEGLAKMTHHTQPTFPLQKGEPQPRDPIVHQPCTLSTSHFPVLGAPSSPYSCTQGGCTSSPPPPPIGGEKQQLTLLGSEQHSGTVPVTISMSRQALGWHRGCRAQPCRAPPWQEAEGPSSPRLLAVRRKNPPL